MTFEEVDSRYATLKRHYDDGALGDGEFDARLKEMMLRDERGRWWSRSRSTGEWFCHDGNAWIRRTPPYSSGKLGLSSDEGGHRPRRRLLRAFIAVAVVISIVVGAGVLSGSGEVAGSVFAALFSMLIVVWVSLAIARAVFRRWRYRWWVTLIGWTMGVFFWLVFGVLISLSQASAGMQ